MIRYFLGANTARGFVSLYSELADESAGDRVIYIKGGPGNGKSTLMKRLAAAAEKAGKTVIGCPCSGDPDSLDAIYIREDRIAYMDATSPHVREPSLPGAAGRYLDLSVCYQHGLEPHRREIEEKYRAYRGHYDRAYDRLRAYELLSPDRIPGLLPARSQEDARELAQELLGKLSFSPSGPAVTKRFLSAITCRGRIHFRESARSVGRVYTLDHALGLDAVFFRQLREACEQEGHAMILCPDPLSPEAVEGILLPEAKTAVLTAWGQPEEDHIPLRSFLDRELLNERREELSAVKPVRDSVLSSAVASLRQAKAQHDELEALYHPYVDFARLEEILRGEMRSLGFAEEKITKK